MAFLHLSINGSTSFGGYLSVDGQKAFAIEDGDVYELANGKHSFVIYTASNFDRGNAKVYDWARSGQKASLLTMATDAARKGADGDSWSFTVNVQETQCAAIDVYTEGSRFVQEPELEVIELPQEKYQEYSEYFEKLRNTPRRNKKQMGWGIGLIAAFAFGLSNAISSGESMSAVAVMIGGIALGVLLFVLGVRKKVRR